jgi:hypothetical protein
MMTNLNGNQDDEMQRKNTKLKYAAATKMLEEAYTEKLENAGITSKPSVGSISNTHQTAGHEFNTSMQCNTPKVRTSVASEADIAGFLVQIQHILSLTSKKLRRCHVDIAGFTLHL